MTGVYDPAGGLLVLHVLRLDHHAVTQQLTAWPLCLLVDLLWSWQLPVGSLLAPCWLPGRQTGCRLVGSGPARWPLTGCWLCVCGYQLLPGCRTSLAAAALIVSSSQGGAECETRVCATGVCEAHSALGSQLPVGGPPSSTEDNRLKAFAHLERADRFPCGN